MSHDDFDTRVRMAHAAALDRLSQRTQTQLRHRSRLARAGAPAQRTHPALRLVLASLAVCAMAVGIVRILPQDAAPPPGIAQQPPPTDTLDESPDFYVWLASDDARALALE